MQNTKWERKGMRWEKWVWDGKWAGEKGKKEDEWEVRGKYQELIPDNEEKQMEKLCFNCPHLSGETTGMGWQNGNHILISFN